jgi:ABC-type branched-subunit amino acid transport system substrate-binding protein
MRHPTLPPCLVASLALFAGIGLAACGGGDGGGGKKTLNLKVGDVVPLTGELSQFGPPGRKAADLAVAEIRKAIQAAAADHTIMIQHQDEQTTLDGAVAAARRLADEEASCIVGPWGREDTLSVAHSVSIPKKILQITPASSSSELTPIKDDGLLNRIAPADNLQGPTLAAVIADQLGGAEGKTVTVGNRGDNYGQLLGLAFQKAWVAEGGRVGTRVQYDPDQATYDSEAERLTSGNPDAFVIVDFPRTYAKLGRALVQTGNWDPGRTFVTDGLVSSSLGKSAGQAATNGLRGIVPRTPERGAGPESFDALYAGSTPKNIGRGAYDAQTFDAVVLCYLAAVAAGSTDGEDMANKLQDVSGPPGAKYTWDRLPEAIKALQDGKDIDYTGAAGDIDLDENGDPATGVYDLVRIGRSGLESVKQVPAQKGTTKPADQ